MELVGQLSSLNWQVKDNVSKTGVEGRGDGPVREGPEDPSVDPQYPCKNLAQLCAPVWCQCWVDSEFQVESNLISQNKVKSF